MVSQLLSLKEIQQAVGQVCAGRPITRVDLFGSRAAGTYGASSDVDLLLEFKTGAKIGLFELGAIREDLVERLGVEVDILSREAVQRSRNAIRRDSILSHTVLVYAR
jgi:predicted nucleotidyltransferase